MRSNQKRMITMNNIPCRNNCIYQECGTCGLDCAALAGMPPLGGACIQLIPEDAVRLGSPHRYYEPGLNADHPAQKVPRRDGPESDTV